MLLDDLRAAIRVRHYSIRTERSYCDWVKRFCTYHGMKHPKDMGSTEIEAFLSHLAVDYNVAASTQNQALQALLFLYRHVLKRDVPELKEIVRAKKPKRLPVVLSLDVLASGFTRLRERISELCTAAVPIPSPLEGEASPHFSPDFVAREWRVLSLWRKSAKRRCSRMDILQSGVWPICAAMAVPSALVAGRR